MPYRFGFTRCRASKTPYILRHFRWQCNFDKPGGRQSGASRCWAALPTPDAARGMKSLSNCPNRQPKSHDGGVVGGCLSGDHAGLI